MSFDLPYYIWLILGLFLGLMIGNKKFRNNVSFMLGKMGGGKPKKQAEHQEQEEEPDQRGEVFTNDKGRVIVYRSRRGTTIREIHFDD